MKAKLLIGLLFVTFSASLSQAGSESGGGGDAATEMKIDSIRADLLSWIKSSQESAQDGAHGLKFPSTLTYKRYISEMEKILLSGAVVIGAVTRAEESATQDPDLKVVVAGQPKACRGFRSEKDGLLHILCNVERFRAATGAEQYRLIHHEYAGIVGLEQNKGASSDYRLSDQITEFLVPETILRLGIKKREVFEVEIITDYQSVYSSAEMGVRNSDGTVTFYEPRARFDGKERDIFAGMSCSGHYADAVNPDGICRLLGFKAGAAARAGTLARFSIRGNRGLTDLVTIPSDGKVDGTVNWYTGPGGCSIYRVDSVTCRAYF